MSAERHIRKLNRLLIAELGDNPPYRWIHSESAEFLRAMRLTDEAGNPEWDYVCPCGRNVSVHSPECVAGHLVIAVPVWEYRKTDPFLEDQWVLCCLQPPPSEHDWTQMFGTLLPYPKNGSWAPVATETRTVAMVPGALPGENFTLAICNARRKTREIKMCDIANAQHYREQKKDADRQWNIRKRIADVLPVNPNPGKRGGSVLVFSEGAK